MPRFHFDLCDGPARWLDDHGDAFPSLVEAAVQAQAILATSFVDCPPDGRGRVLTCEIRDDEGKVLHRARLAYEVEQREAE